jgi:uncharacterized GH25 family protein
MPKKGIRIACCFSILITAIIISIFFNVNKVFASPAEETKVKCSGKVVDDKGQAVNEAKVQFHTLSISTGSGSVSFDRKLAGEITTKTDGLFSFEMPKKDETAGREMSFIIAQKEGLAIGWVNWDMKADKKDIEIKLAEAKELAGVVVDSNDKPIADAQVSIFILFRGNPEDEQNAQYIINYDVKEDLFPVKTDSQGKFVFKNIPADAKAEFIVKKARRATISTYSGNGVPGKYLPGQSDIKLVQPIEARIEGVVIEKESGKGVKGVKIVAAEKRNEPFLGENEAISKEDGTFSIGNLAPNKQIILKLAPQEAAKSEWTAEEAVVDTEEGKTTKGIKIEVSKGGLLEVVVTEADTKKPVEQVSVSLQGSIANQWFSCLTDKDGVGQIRLSPGEYTLNNVYKQGYSSRIEQQGVTIENGKTTRLEIQLKGQPKITGVVRDKEGKPLDGVKIQAMPMGGGMAISTTKGKFEIAWTPERWGGSEELTYYLIARYEKNNLAEAVKINEDTKQVEIKLKDGLIFTGKVVDPNKNPIADADITILLKTINYSSSIARAKGDKEGRFEINAIPSDPNYDILASADGFGTRNVEIGKPKAENNRFDAGQLELLVANLSVTGVVVEPNNQPVADADISSHGEGQPLGHSTKTDKDGKFIVEKVCEGEINIYASVRRKENFSGSVNTEGGAKDVKIVVSEGGRLASRYVPRRAESSVGRQLPQLKDLGIELTTPDANDKAVLICFFDFQQRASRNMIKELAERTDSLKEKGITIAGVQASKMSQDTLDEWIKQYKVSFPVGQIAGDEKKTKFNWGVQSLPWLILTDKKHIIKAEGFALGELEEKIKKSGE